MAGRTPVDQGTLDRTKAWINIPAFGGVLSVDAGFLAPEGIRLSFDDLATDLLPTMTGMVTSPKPYQGVTVTIALVKSTYKATQYQRQFNDQTLLGDAWIFPDALNLVTFPLHNVTLETIREMSFGGTEAAMVVTLRGYRDVNTGFFGSVGTAL
jgi:hypothetical protein